MLFIETADSRTVKNEATDVHMICIYTCDMSSHASLPRSATGAKVACKKASWTPGDLSSSVCLSSLICRSGSYPELVQYVRMVWFCFGILSFCCKFPYGFFHESSVILKSSKDGTGSRSHCSLSSKELGNDLLKMVGNDLTSMWSW